MNFKTLASLVLLICACAPRGDETSSTAGAGGQRLDPPPTQKAFLDSLYNDKDKVKVAELFSDLFYLELYSERLIQLSEAADSNASEAMKRTGVRVVTHVLGLPGLIAGFQSWKDFSEFIEGKLNSKNRGRPIKISSEKWEVAYVDYVALKKEVAEKLNSLLQRSQLNNRGIDDRKDAEKEMKQLISASEAFLKYANKDLTDTTSIGHFYLIQRLKLGLTINPD